MKGTSQFLESKISVKQFKELGNKYGLDYGVKTFPWTVYSKMHWFKLDNLCMVVLYECRGGAINVKVTNPVELRYNGNGLTATDNFVERYLFVHTIDELKRLMDVCMKRYKDLKKEYRINEIREL